MNQLTTGLLAACLFAAAGAHAADQPKRDALAQEDLKKMEALGKDEMGNDFKRRSGTTPQQALANEDVRRMNALGKDEMGNDLVGAKQSATHKNGSQKKRRVQKKAASANASSTEASKP